MDKIKTVKIKNPDGSVSEETYTISVDAKDVDMANGKELQETVGTINIDTDGNIAYQLDNLKNNKVNKTDIIDNLNSVESNKVLSANQGKVLGDAITTLNEDIKKKVYYFDTVADMKADIKLKAGDMAVTLGYYSANDDGGASYKITSEESETDYQEELDNGLYATLIIKDYVTPEMFGAKGDGTHDDTDYLQIALNSEKGLSLFEDKTYLITDNIDLPHLVSIEGNNATIKVDYSGNREHPIQNANWLDNENNLNTLYLNNINFYVNSTSAGIKLIGLTDYNKITITNCNYSNNSSISYGTWFLDMYSNNSNVLIDNVNVNTSTTNENLFNTGIGLREYRNSKTSNNIIISNSNFKHNGKDEVIWCDSWKGTLKNVIIDKCVIEDNSTTSSTFCYFGNSGDNTTILIENINIINCILIKDVLSTNGLKLGSQNSTNSTDKNINVINTDIIVKTGAGSIITTGSTNGSITIENCNIISESSAPYIQYGYIVKGNIKLRNSKFKVSSAVTSASYALYQVKDIENCNFDIDCVTFVDGSAKIYNSIINKCQKFISFGATSSNALDLDIQNCQITCSGRFADRSNNSGNQSIKIRNSNVTIGDTMFNDYNMTGTCEIDIINTNINCTTFRATNNANESIKFVNNTHNYQVISGIPSQASDRGAYVVGTIFDGGASHSVVRKISVGNETTNWETL